MIDLSVTRKEIDKIDSEIVRLFEKRMEAANEVAKYKMETGKAVYDKEREDQKLDALGKLSHGEFNEWAVKELFSQIMSISRKYQYGVLHGSEKVTDFEKVDTIYQKKDPTVYYFGVPGTHTQQAMEEVFGSQVNGVSCRSFQGVMEAVKEEKADFGVLPIENSSTGGITANYDLLLNYENAIVGHYVMKINQCLLGMEGAELDSIQTVYSHPQGLLQSRDFMEAHPNMTGVEYASTAEAAKRVAKDQDLTQAAIASRRAAREYGLKILAEDIQSEKNNCTRFIIIGPKPLYTKESNRVAMCIELPHQSGSLCRILSHFLYNGLNLTLIESRPIPGRNWEYRFFLDVEGNLDDPAMSNALRGVKEESAAMRVLGNFQV